MGVPQSSGGVLVARIFRRYIVSRGFRCQEIFRLKELVHVGSLQQLVSSVTCQYHYDHWQLSQRRPQICEERMWLTYTLSPGSECCLGGTSSGGCPFPRAFSLGLVLTQTVNPKPQTLKPEPLNQVGDEV